MFTFLSVSTTMTDYFNLLHFIVLHTCNLIRTFMSCSPSSLSLSLIWHSVLAVTILLQLPLILSFSLFFSLFIFCSVSKSKSILLKLFHFLFKIVKYSSVWRVPGSILILFSDYWYKMHEQPWQQDWLQIISKLQVSRCRRSQWYLKAGIRNWNLELVPVLHKTVELRNIHPCKISCSI